MGGLERAKPAWCDGRLGVVSLAWSAQRREVTWGPYDNERESMKEDLGFSK